MAVERPAIARVDDGAATRRHDGPDPRLRVGRADVRDGLPLDRSECGLTLLGEDLRDRSTGGLLDRLIEIDEGGPVTMGEPASDRALAAPRQPDQDDVHAAA